MKHLVAIAIISLASSLAVSGADPVKPEADQLAVALKELQVQQSQIMENQAKIEARLAKVAETIRVARIYSSRGGN